LFTFYANLPCFVIHYCFISSLPLRSRLKSSELSNPVSLSNYQQRRINDYPQIPTRTLQDSGHRESFKGSEGATE
jgi:hypothetical protein